MIMYVYIYIYMCMICTDILFYIIMITSNTTCPDAGQTYFTARALSVP